MRTQHSNFWRIVSGHVRQEKASVALAVLGMVALAVTDLLRPWPLKIIFDYVLLERPVPESLAFGAEWFESKKAVVVIAVSSAIIVIAALRGHCITVADRLATAFRLPILPRRQAIVPRWQSVALRCPTSTGATGSLRVLTHSMKLPT